MPEDVLRQIVNDRHLNTMPKALTVSKGFVLANSDLSHEEIRWFARRITGRGLTTKQLRNILQQRFEVKTSPKRTLTLRKIITAKIRALQNYCKMQGFNPKLKESKKCVTFKVCFEEGEKT